MATTVRPLSEGEKESLGALLRELHTHVESCAPCLALGAAAETAADLVGAKLCEEGERLYQRWIGWLAKS